MTEDDFRPIGIALHQTIDATFTNEGDRHAAYVWLNQLILVLFLNEFPLKHKKFPELLHILANTLQLMVETENKKK